MEGGLAHMEAGLSHLEQGFETGYGSIESGIAEHVCLHFLIYACTHRRSRARKVTIMCILQIDQKDDGVDVGTVIQVLAAAQPVSCDRLAHTSVQVHSL